MTDDGMREKHTGIEITPEMAAAGARVLAERYDGLGDFIDEDNASEVFRAMVLASRGPSSQLSQRFEDGALKIPGRNASRQMTCTDR
jgi:hypothetical protein